MTTHATSLPGRRPIALAALAAVGRVSVAQWRHAVGALAVAAAVVLVSLRPGSWPRTTREVLSRQVLRIGVEAVPFTSRVAFLVGISVVVQAQLWLSKVGQSELLGPVLVTVIIRELGPLLANLIVIGRSGNAIAAELGNMKVSHEVRVLDAQGLDPFAYILLPRVVGMAVSVFCLTIVFIVASLCSGYLCGLLVGAKTGGIDGFVGSVARAIGPADVVNVFVKSVVPGLLTGSICTVEGLNVGREHADVARASTRAVQRSVVALFMTSAVVSFLTYL